MKTKPESDSTRNFEKKPIPNWSLSEIDKKKAQDIKGKGIKAKKGK